MGASASSGQSAAAGKGRLTHQPPCQQEGQAGLPSHLHLYRSGELQARIERARLVLRHCTLCPRECGVDRAAGELGYCRAGALPKVASWNVHPWEEPPISGTRGSGTIFLSHCTGRCLFCQNYPISQLGVGSEVSEARLAGMMMELQRKRCHNINWVSPTHYVPQIIAALALAIPQGFHLPLVYNTSGYDSVETIRLLDGVMDIYLPDAKYDNDERALRLSGFRGYVAANQAALREMYAQVGDELIVDEDGIALRGMIIRHMVLPEGLAGTRNVLSWVARELSPRVHISLMAQYFPAHRATGDPVLGRRISPQEYVEALEAFDAALIECGWRQEYGEDEGCCPG